MPRLCTAALLGCMLAGCAGQSGTGSASSELAPLESLYLAAAAAALTYESLPGADPAVVATINADEHTAWAGLEALQTAIQAGETPAASAFTAVAAAIAALQAAVPAAPLPGAAVRRAAK